MSTIAERKKLGASCTLTTYIDDDLTWYVISSVNGQIMLTSEQAEQLRHILNAQARTMILDAMHGGI